MNVYIYEILVMTVYETRPVPSDQVTQSVSQSQARAFGSVVLARKLSYKPKTVAPIKYKSSCIPHKCAYALMAL